jgi:hypothetical protein
LDDFASVADISSAKMIDPLGISAALVLFDFDWPFVVYAACQKNRRQILCYDEWWWPGRKLAKF